MVPKLQIFGWSMYDFANTIFSALFVTVYFPLFVVLKGGNAFHVGLVMSLSMLAAGLLVPFLGAVADITQRKKIMLIVFTVLCCVATFLTGWFGLLFILVFGLLAKFFFHAGLDVYDALLVNISSAKNRGWISGLGVALGYCGTILSVAIAYLVGLRYGFESLEGIRIVFALVAVLFLLFSLFTFVLVKEPGRVRITAKHAGQAFHRVISTIKGIRKYKNIWLLLLASFFYADAAHTVIIFMYLYARDQLGLSLVQFLPLYVITAVTAALGAFVFGKITDKFGHKRTLLFVLAAWIAIIILLYVKTVYSVFVFVALVGGALLGAVWTITRPILVQIAPRQKIAELLGYQGLTEKFSGVLGPVLFGLVSVLIGFRHALLIIIVLFLLGAFTLLKVSISSERLEG